MSASIILGRLPSEIQAAMGLALLQIKCRHKLSLDDIGSIIGRTRESVSQYIAAEAEMGATCWLRATEMWPELTAMVEDNLDEAKTKQRSLNLLQPAPETEAA